MTPSARLQAVLDLLVEIEKVPRPADALVSAYFRARRYIGSHDRAAVSAMLYDILRHRGRLGWWIERVLDSEDGQNPLPCHSLASDRGVRVGGPQQGQSSELQKQSLLNPPPPNLPREGGGTIPSRLHLLAYLALAEKRSAKEVEQSFSGGKFAPASLSDEEQKFVRRLENHTVTHPEMPDAVKVECPAWAAASLKQRFGKNFVHEMEALLQPAPLDLRVNELKAAREDILKELKKLGLKAEPCPLSPLGIRVRERPNLSALPMLKNGSVEIQDEGSQLVALAVEAKPGMRVVDFCAGAGGKTLAIAVQMQNKGRITACDVLANRLKRSTERFRRAGVHNIETKALADARDPWVKKHKASFDRVLVDAPCSGVGAWRRNPDARWRSLGPGLEALVKLQVEILDSAARLVKPGGRLIYATCSLLPEENELQVETFLTSHEDFKLVPYKTNEDFLSLAPAQHDSDGFFAAVMERSNGLLPARGEDVKT